MKIGMNVKKNRTCNSTIRFSKYEFYNIVLSGVILLSVTQVVTWTVEPSLIQGLGSSYTFYYYYYYRVSTMTSVSDDSSIIRSRYQSLFGVGGDWTRISYSTIRNFTSWIKWGFKLYLV